MVKTLLLDRIMAEFLNKFIFKKLLQLFPQNVKNLV